VLESAAVPDPAARQTLIVLIALDRFGEIGGVELELPLRTTPVRAADFSS
jgi:hypothetical protein